MIFISIHALLAESDVISLTLIIGFLEFLSTLSLRRATALGLLGWLRVLISIHALLAESDVNDAINGCNPDFISIHALLAESDFSTLDNILTLFTFLSTLSLRRATPPSPPKAKVL